MCRCASFFKIDMTRPEFVSTETFEAAAQPVDEGQVTQAVREIAAAFYESFGTPSKLDVDMAAAIRAGEQDAAIPVLAIAFARPRLAFYADGYRKGVEEAVEIAKSTGGAPDRSTLRSMIAARINGLIQSSQGGGGK
jgi:hypothetical protein